MLNRKGLDGPVKPGHDVLGDWGLGARSHEGVTETPFGGLATTPRRRNFLLLLLKKEALS
jgi:hypothetical protein